MEPQLPSPSHQPETGPVQSNEQLAPLRAPEHAPLPSGGERTESHEQQPNGGGPGDPAAVQPVAPPPLPQLQPVGQSQQQSQPQDTNPAVAADDDLIEKEWVEKAKKVIAETKHDPHLQEQAVSRLQADYLQKRYGKTVKLPSDG
jgi:uncharacterized protein (DUF4415 family)